MKKTQLKQINSIPKRANCKLAQVGQRNFLIGGLTADTVTTQICQFRINNLQSNLIIQWKKIPMDKKLFTQRNSFAICPVQNKIYIYGGNQTIGQNQKSLSDLIQFNTGKIIIYKLETSKLSSLNIKNPISIHSTVLIYDKQTNSLISYGGTDQQSKLQSFLCKLKLDDLDNLQWQKIRIQCKAHQGLVWQHSGHLIKKSLINKDQQGKFLIVIGGCIQPFMPYKQIIQINLQDNKVNGMIQLQNGLVSQDSVVVNDALYIFGGSNGSGFNNNIYIVKDGQIKKETEKYTGLGCACLNMKEGILVYGGAKDGQSFNGTYLFEQK